ncbi:MAG: 16S rRNA (guanine(966)-N(2))-methyltransferase RsmD [Omnitrophica bacterium RIFCSPLOWO2_12_FULL_44_17]|uniref:16S rRNA (Guanine(966)-N(2))-methyltransferase RsmD n=1 Tax=Candidatus Danuiimicrobium aquiferis TaxID=1801832 RepID=A0A1G1KYI4_9BACT|nr:MAG: 16S rRNA (guanine(966)-N(2))-methyltransferase RsmD [Omnitrophica bacterium RIFCSPHIGHO2_02_FULL_45_28]OGW90243.1 MAG: 16S rRNA (guanine(966)-N(2))-methyltransferase RsmD [Omnitrophica bacterium RIFCSPHIGHO2_12_FULL_44_12]OGW97970.1 MAG: 16S rRNA (guanine(966)-N(2))-methyltransferase RsmD [Omnitrophica bacterium RIFCSPLOWO2_12_FULL_44_17]OGX02532.1 MAG: 16S rRNA (guanine(966)-N(2))-methyltransferase RsmD [Omnitrophica bacterium RIFCSPLOWO2_02_FULL_44_11]
MRIIGGRLKRRLIDFPKTRDTRPLTDRSKETIFNILATLPESAHILDLYAGSGSFGLEALSRGAQFVDFVDHAPICKGCISDNLKKLELAQMARIHTLEVEIALKQFEKSNKKFDLIFVDPPHNKGLIKKTLNEIDRSDILPIEGHVIVGHSNKEDVPEDLVTLIPYKKVKIGQSFVSFFIKCDVKNGSEKGK